MAGGMTEIYQEGLRIPPSRIWRRGEPDENLFRLIERNVRVPDKVLGDIRSLVAACVASLRRLVREYVRTERRARALENVVLPEIDGSLRFIEEQLDAVDQEEAVRVRNAGAARA